MVKVKDDQVGKVHQFHLEPLTFNLNNEEITSCTVVPTFAPTIQSTPPSKLGSSQTAVLGAIEQYIQDNATDEDGSPKDNFGIPIAQAISIGSQVLTCSNDKRNHTSKKCVEQLISKGLLEMQNGLVMIKQ